MTDERWSRSATRTALRPLRWAMIEDPDGGPPAYCVASESCAFDLIGATLPP